MALTSRHDTLEIMEVAYDPNNHPNSSLLTSFTYSKVALITKRANIHTATVPGKPGTPTWRVRYIKIASMLPINVAATAMEVFLSSGLQQLQQTSDSVLRDMLAERTGEFWI